MDDEKFMRRRSDGHYSQTSSNELNLKVEKGVNTDEKMLKNEHRHCEESLQESIHISYYLLSEVHRLGKFFQLF